MEQDEMCPDDRIKDRVYCNDCKHIVVFHDPSSFLGSYIRCNKMGVRSMRNTYHEWRELGNPGDWNNNNDCPGFERKNNWLPYAIIWGAVLVGVILVVLSLKH